MNAFQQIRWVDIAQFRYNSSSFHVNMRNFEKFLLFVIGKKSMKANQFVTNTFIQSSMPSDSYVSVAANYIIQWL